MPTGNFEDSVDPTSPPQAGVQPVRRWPSDYYSAPLSEVKPVFPRWVPWGCGGAAILVLVIMFTAGAMLTGSRLSTFIDLVMGMSVGEMKGMYSTDVTAEQKESVDAEIGRMREALREGRISVQEVQPFLQEMQRAVGDDKVTRPEADALAAAARKAADAKPATPGK